MRFTKKKNDTSTIRKVWNDEKTICYGLIGTVADFMEKDILRPISGIWAYIPKDGSIIITANTREELLKNIY